MADQRVISYIVWAAYCDWPCKDAIIQIDMNSREEAEGAAAKHRKEHAAEYEHFYETGLLFKDCKDPKHAH